MTALRILVVDDDALSREFLQEAVQALGHRPTVAENGARALEKISAELPDMVLTDLRMPEVDGTELVRRVASDWPGLPVVVITANGTIEAAVEAMKLGAVDFLLKPCTPDALELVIDRVQRTARLLRENEYLRSEISSSSTSLIAESPAMLDLLRSASRLARSKGTVLISGESGTGKERIASYIHAGSPRAEAPFIRVNCAALSETLLESELFGHERGAFTGAHRTRAGRFELADGGTLLLDELGEISPAMQSKLLRVLQEDQFERVGGQDTIQVDVRVIAATTRDLAGEVAAGRFREDLYYRLHVLPLHIAPLRERREDILPLAQHFAEHHARQNGVTPPVLTEDARQRLVAWSWPGNVRELENVVQRAVILGAEGRIASNDLIFGPASGASEGGAGKSAASLTLEDPEFAAVLANQAVSDIERVAILATLESTSGNKTEAARRLGLTARTLSNKMKIWRQAGLVA